MNPDGSSVPAGEFQLASYQAKLGMRLISMRGNDASKRIWAKDPTYWPRAAPADVQSRLGWLTLPSTMAPSLADLRAFAAAVKDEGFQHLLLLGMGGSSLAPEVFSRTFGSAPGYPELTVLDSTHPEAVQRLIRPETIAKTLFIVSSKSGTTLEPNAFFRYAWAKASAAGSNPGRQFIAITDPGTPLQSLAEQRAFRRCFLATPDVGGRYSALTAFGIVPCALIGHDPAGLLASAARMASASGASVLPEESPGLRLGAALGELALLHRDKVIFLTSPSLRAFPGWAEQLIAESLGKDGHGIVPVPDEADPTQATTGRDSVLVRIRLAGEADAPTEAALDVASQGGIPVLRFEVASTEDLGQEMFRWEFAIASAGAIIGVNPFDQPDVELAKELARQAMAPSRSGAGESPEPPPAHPVADPSTRERAVAWMTLMRPGDYIAVQAFLSPTDAVRAGVVELSRRLRQRSRIATTFGFGPRFLHSTGQMHKGGPSSGVFLQLVDQPASDVDVPEMGISFGRILRAQADGDALALAQMNRRLLRFDLGTDPVQGLQRLVQAFAP